MEELLLTNIVQWIIIIASLLLISAIFWIWMFIDILKWKSEKKVGWIVGMIVGGWFGVGVIIAIIYYFVIKKPRDKEVAENPIPQSTLDIERERKEQERERMNQ